MFNINSTLSRRNFLAGAAALGSTAALAGCSSGGSDGGTADDGKTFKIGVIGPLTGAAATYGVSAEKGAKLAAKDFSTKDIKLSLKSEDDVADGDRFGRLGQGVAAFLAADGVRETALLELDQDRFQEPGGDVLGFCNL